MNKRSTQLYREVYSQLKRIKTVNLVDLSAALDGHGDVYFDWCHLTAEGNEIVARRLADELDAMISSLSD